MKYLKKYSKILLLLLGLILILYALFEIFSPGRSVGRGDKKIEFEVSRGKGPQALTSELQKEGLLRSPEYFSWLLRFTNRSTKLKAGVYELNDGMSAGEIARILTEGRVRMLSLTIPEGWNNRQIGDYLASKNLVLDRIEFLKLAEDPAVLEKFHIPARSTEGYLFPDTYNVPLKYPASRLQEVMIRHFFEVLEEMQVEQRKNPVELHKIVILASIVEREAQRPEERPIMSQVFLNRIQKRMRLESCATIQYLFDRPHPRLFEKDLFIESPYNTYRHSGMPPGPISNPGKAALQAAVHPDDVPYLYFVRKPDGSHFFSERYRDHMEAKKRYVDPLFAN